MTVRRIALALAMTSVIACGKKPSPAIHQDPPNDQQATRAPDAPTNVTAEGGARQATVSWTAPAKDGGKPVQKYTVRASPGGAKVDVAAPLTTTTFQNLQNGTAYTFTVTATNEVGTSAASAASNEITPMQRPGAPLAVAAIAGDAAATVSWTAPADDGGSAITSYVVRSAPGDVEVTTGASTTQAQVTGLTNGVAYTFTVTATNSLGAGPASEASAPVTPARKPNAPTGVVADAGNAEATISWAAPEDDGGSELTGYVIRSSVGNIEASTDAFTTQTVIAGLTNGTTYTFTVSAVNGIGTGPASVASAPVTPSTIPAAPTDAVAVRGDLEATISWTAPTDNGGAEITGFVVYDEQNTVVAEPDATASSATIMGLTNGTMYLFKVAAKNLRGIGAATDTNPVIPAGVPTAPGNVVAAAMNKSTAGKTQVHLSWTPSVGNGRDVTEYTITATPGDVTWTVQAPASEAIVTELEADAGKEYTFAIAAKNEVGTSVEATSNLMPYPCGSAGFKKGQSSGSISGFSDVFVEDLTGDGQKDVVLIQNDTVQTLRGNGNGTVTNLASMKPGGSGLKGIGLADFTGDGILDIAVTQTNNNNVAVMKGDGSGAFTAFSTGATSNAPWRGAAGDLNGDGKPDIAVVNRKLAGQMDILLNDGTGAFGNYTAVTTRPTPVFVASRDLNGDGHHDLVVASDNQTDNIEVFLNDGAGGFSSSVRYTPFPRPERVHFADMNNDNVIDIVASTGLSSPYIGVLLGKGDGTFTKATTAVPNSAGYLYSLALADFNGDGAIDAAGGLHGYDFGLWLGQGTGNMTAPWQLGGQQIYASQVGVADFNGDGLNDIVAPNAQSFNSLTILLGTCTP